MSNTATIYTDSSFQAIPDTNLSDWTILTFVKNLSKGGFVSVEYIATAIDYTRETVSRKLSKLVADGWVGRLIINKRKTQYCLTQKALDAISLYIKKREEAKAERIRLKNEKNRKIKEQKALEQTAFNTEAETPTTPEASESQPPDTKAPKNRRHYLYDHFMIDWQKTGLPGYMLEDSVYDYVDYCEHKGAFPTLTGCRKRLEAVVVSAQAGQVAHDQAQAFNQAKQDKLAALIKKNEMLAERYESENINLFSMKDL